MWIAWTCTMYDDWFIQSISLNVWSAWCSCTRAVGYRRDIPHGHSDCTLHARNSCRNLLHRTCFFFHPIQNSTMLNVCSWFLILRSLVLILDSGFWRSLETWLSIIGHDELVDSLDKGRRYDRKPSEQASESVQLSLPRLTCFFIILWSWVASQHACVVWDTL